MIYTALGLLCKKQARIISLSSDNFSGKLKAVDLSKFGLALIWLTLESNSLELPWQCKLGKLQDFSGTTMVSTRMLAGLLQEPSSGL